MATEKLDAEKKTAPKTATKFADKETFAKDFLVHFVDSSKVSQEDIDVNKKDVTASALQRGLRPTGEVTLANKKVVDEHNVLLSYSVEVEANTIKK